MRNCFVKGCDYKNKHLKKRSMFLAPKDITQFRKWAKVLHNFRPLKAGDCVCQLHFHPHEIQTSFEHVINGQIYNLERDRVRLNANAVPSLLLPSIEELQLNKRTKPRKKPTTAAVKVVKVQLNGKELSCKVSQERYQKDETIEEHSINESSTPELVSGRLESDKPHITDGDVVLVETQPQSINETFNNFYDDVFEVVLPNNLWGVHRCPQRSIILFTCMDVVKLCPNKMLTIDSEGTIKTYLATRLRTVLDSFNNKSTQIIEEVSDLLTELDETCICRGAEFSLDCEVEIKKNSEESEEERSEDQLQLCNTCIVNEIEMLL